MNNYTGRPPRGTRNQDLFLSCQTGSSATCHLVQSTCCLPPRTCCLPPDCYIPTYLSTLPGLPRLPSSLLPSINYLLHGACYLCCCFCWFLARVGSSGRNWLFQNSLWVFVFCEYLSSLGFHSSPTPFT